jgi:hypothetical protein
MEGILGSRIGVSALIVVVAGSALGAEAPRPRAEFVRAIDKVRPGMKETAVRALLGKPDDIRTRRDRGGVGYEWVREIWRYGTLGYLRTATLGQVWFKQDGRVGLVIGQGSLPPAGPLPESELRIVLDALGEVPSFDRGSQFNPLPLIRAVNLLQPLGKKKALAAIDEFLRISTVWCRDGEKPDGIFLVLRTLFDAPNVANKGIYDEELPPGVLPPVNVGLPHPEFKPADAKLLPRYPLAIEGDIPFLLVTGYVRFGAPPDPVLHLRYFRERGVIRARPLVPTNKPLDAIDSFANSPSWIFGRKDKGFSEYEFGAKLVRQQVLRMLSTVDRPDPDGVGDLLPDAERQESRRRIADASQLKIQWDAHKNCYTFLDGSTLPELDPNRYGRHEWKHMGPKLTVELILERDSRHWLTVDCRQRHGTQTQTGSLKVMKVGWPSPPLLEMPIANGLSGFGTSAPTDEGEEVQAELTVGKDSWRSPVFKP